MNISKLKWAPVILYTFVILHITLFSRTPMSESVVTGLFWEFQRGYWKDIVLNILLFLPLGFLLGIATENMKIAIYGFILSVFIELFQYALILGWCQADDVLNNTMGTAVGFGFWKMLSVLIWKWKNKRV